MVELQRPRTIEGQNLVEAWSKVVEMIRQVETRAVYNLIVYVAEPTRMVPQPLHEHEEEIKGWATKLRSMKPDGLPFTHGQRLFAWAIGQRKTSPRGRFDQIGDFVVPMLVRNPRTKRAIAMVTDPSLDGGMTDDPIPALVLVQFRLDKESLHATAYFRAQEMYFFWVVNMFEIISLQEAICLQLRQRSPDMLVRPGSITTIAFSGYINPIDLQRAAASKSATLAIERFGISRMKPERLDQLLESAFVEAKKKDLQELANILVDDIRKLDRVRDIDYEGLKLWQLFMERKEKSLLPQFHDMPELLRMALAQIVSLDMDLERDERPEALRARIESASNAMRRLVDALQKSTG